MMTILALILTMTTLIALRLVRIASWREVVISLMGTNCLAAVAKRKKLIVAAINQALVTTLQTTSMGVKVNTTI